MWEAVSTFIAGIQRLIYETVSEILVAFAQDHDWSGLIAIMPLGIVFGAVHALTPGHGKSVLAAYLAGSPATLIRGVVIAGALSVTHVLCAVIIAVLALPLVSVTLGSVGEAPLLTNLSRGLLAALGLLLIWRALRRGAHIHGEGMTMGVIAGLIPCPLTLFAMVFAISRGVPEAGLAFAVAMATGITLTLGGVAVAAILARGAMAGLLARHGASVTRVSRLLEGTAGLLLVVVSLWEMGTR